MGGGGVGGGGVGGGGEGAGGEGEGGGGEGEGGVGGGGEGGKWHSSMYASCRVEVGHPNTLRVTIMFAPVVALDIVIEKSTSFSSTAMEAVSMLQPVAANESV